MKRNEARPLNLLWGGHLARLIRTGETLIPQSFQTKLYIASFNLIKSLLRSRQRQQTQQAMAEACLALDELELEWGEEWEQAAITDWEVSSESHFNG